MSKPKKKRVSFGAVETRIISPRASEEEPQTTATTATTAAPSTAPELSSLTAAEVRILRSDRAETRIANDILDNDKFNQNGEARENGTDGDPNAVRGELTGVSVPTTDDFGYVVEPFNLTEERDTGLLRAARNTSLVGRGEEEDHQEDQWLKDNDVIDSKTLARMKAKEQAREQQENDRREKSDQAWLEDVIRLLVAPTETVPMGLRRLRPTTNKLRGKSWRNRQAPSTAATTTTAATAATAATTTTTTTTATATTTNTTATTTTVASFEHLTEASSELMSRGYDDVYVITKQQMEEKLEEGKREKKSSNKRASSSSSAGDEGNGSDNPSLLKKRRIDPAAASTCMWYYKRNLQQEDAPVHGPFSSEKMVAWRKIGYFVGDNVVFLRRDPPYLAARKEDGGGDDADDLMNDLEDDLGEEDNTTTTTTEGDGSGSAVAWFSSEGIDFD